MRYRLREVVENTRIGGGGEIETILSVVDSQCCVSFRRTVK